MDFYTAAQTVAMTPVKQIDTVFTTPTRTQPGSAASRRAPLTRTLSSPAFSYGLPAAATSGVAGYHAHRPSSSGEWSAAMSRRDSTSSFASSMDSFPMTPLTEEFISPDQIFRHSGSFSSGMPSVRPRSVTQGTHDLAMTPYLSSYNGAAKMQRRHTHMGEVTPMSQEMCASPSWQGNPYEMQGQHMEYTPGMHQQQLIAQQAAYAALHAHSRTHTRSGSNVSLMATPGTLATPLRATPMQHTMSSPLSEMSLAQMNVFEAAQYIEEEQETDADAGTAAVPVKTPTKGPATPVKRAKKVPLVVSDIKDKPHVCPHCSARFARLEHVKRHERTHTGAKPFLCSIEGCGEVFSRSDNLRAHERTHARAGRNTKAMAKKKLQAAQSASMTHSRSTSSEDGAATTSTAVTATPTSEKPQRASPKHRAAAKAAAKAKTAVIAPQPAITSAATSRDPSPVMEQSREAEMQSSQQAAAIALNQGSHFAELQPGPTAEELEADYLFQEELMQQQAFLFQQQQLHLQHQQQQHLPQEGLSNQYKVEEAFGQYAYTDAL